MLKFRKNIVCCNCGKPGHIYKKCFQPITSIGIICAKIINNEIKYLFMRRKDSLSFSEIVRAGYNIQDKNYIKDMLQRITQDELEFLKNAKSSDEIWNKLWTDKIKNFDFTKAKSKLQQLIDGVTSKNETYSFSSLIENISSPYIEPEWGFPKGRRMPKESEIQCAIREFVEETEFPIDKLKILKTKPVEETFAGSNGVRYRHIYYLAYCDEEVSITINPDNKFQKAEVSKLEWMKSEDVIDRIRDHYKERKELVKRVTEYFNSIKID